jgi:hypothetical protein
MTQTSELTGAALDWAVAKCEGRSVVKDPFLFHEIPAFSTDWAQGGPIIERERIGLDYAGANEWIAWQEYTDSVLGSTPLEAAMRCYVASKLGDNVEIPSELTKC